jgi:hypothetical protein
MKNINSNFRFKWHQLALLVFVCAMAFTACNNSTSGRLGPLPKVSFTATPLSNNPNKIVVKSTSKNTFLYSWNFGNGTTSQSKTDTVTFIFKGTYTIKLTAYGHGGADSTSKKVDIAHTLEGKNILKDGGALKSSDWTYLNIPGGGNLDVTYSNSTINFQANPFSYGAIYQAVPVDAGKYLFSAHIKGAGMGSQTWFEIYIGTTKPEQSADYMDNEFVALNTYVPCGGSPFDGNLAKIGCEGSGIDTGGIITFDKSGIAYVVIKAGSNGGFLGKGGITLENISMIKL